MDAEAKSILEKIIHAHRSGEREAMSLASVAAYVRGDQRQAHVARRMDAQVDAMLKAKYAECGQPDAYEPPKEPTDDSMGTLINCTFNGDDAVNQITKVLGKAVREDSEKQPEPVTPEKKETEKPRTQTRDNALAKAALIGASLVAGGGLTYIATKYLDPSQTTIVSDPSIYSLEAYNPTE